MRVKVQATMVWEFDTESSVEEAAGQVRSQLNALLTDEKDKLRTFVQVDRVRSGTQKARLGEIPVEQFLEQVSDKPKKKTYEFDGRSYSVKMNGDRYRLFKQNRNCVSCGLEGTRCFLESQTGDDIPHFNLYGSDRGRLVLLTKDHIRAKACGGADELSNYQTMCSVCNTLKAHMNVDLESLRRLRAVYDQNKERLSKRQLHALIEQERSSLETPWPGSTVKAGTGKGPDSIRVTADLYVRRWEGGLEASAVQADKGCVCKIEADAHLTVLVEVNDECVCQLPDGQAVRIKKALVSDR